MRKNLTIVTILLFTIILTLTVRSFLGKNTTEGAPPYGEPETNVPSLSDFTWLYNWERPEGPAKVALQVGHYLNDELPDELEKLRTSDGASGRGYSEWEVNLAIANEVKRLLEEKGVKVEIFPATIPSKYWADVFLAIHADGSDDRSKRGFKIAAPWRDFTKNADNLVEYLYDSYSEATGFATDENITRNMRGYYAFSWWKYNHAIHPMTTAAIIECGFLTNYYDHQILTKNPELPAQGITNGILDYLIKEDLL